VLRRIDRYVLKSSRGMDEPSTLRSGWYCCIRRDSSRWSSFWPTMLPNFHFRFANTLNLQMFP